MGITIMYTCYMTGGCECECGCGFGCGCRGLEGEVGAGGGLVVLAVNNFNTCL